MNNPPSFTITESIIDGFMIDVFDSKKVFNADYFFYTQAEVDEFVLGFSIEKLAHLILGEDYL